MWDRKRKKILSLLTTVQDQNAGDTHSWSDLVQAFLWLYLYIFRTFTQTCFLLKSEILSGNNSYLNTHVLNTLKQTLKVHLEHTLKGSAHDQFCQEGFDYRSFNICWSTESYLVFRSGSVRCERLKEDSRKGEDGLTACNRRLPWAVVLYSSVRKASIWCKASHLN